MKRIGTKRLLLALAILVVFGRTILNDFVDWDDTVLILHNATFNPPTPAGMLSHWRPADANNFQMYDPLVFTVWWGLAKISMLKSPDLLGGMFNPLPFHAANVIVHIFSTLIVFEILRKLRMRDGPAFAGAMLFAIHPIQTEAVAWATGMKDLLAGFFVLLGIWRYVISAQANDSPRRRMEYVVASVAFVAALLCKPSAVVAPLMAGAIDLILIRRSWKEASRWLAPWCILAIAFIAIAGLIQKTAGIVETVPPWMRPLIAADSVTFYAWKMLVPLNYCIDYGRSPHAIVNDPGLHHPLMWCWIAPLVIVLILWRFRRRELNVAMLVMFLGVLPVLGLAAFAFQSYSTVADRYFYVSMLGAAMVLAWIVREFSHRAVNIAVGIVMIVFASSAFLQAGIWKDTQTLLDHALAQNPKSARLYLNEGVFLTRLADADQRQGHPEDARAKLQQCVQLYQRSIAIDPSNGLIYLALSDALLKSNQPAESEVVLEHAMRLLDSHKISDGTREQELCAALKRVQTKEKSEADTRPK